MAFLFQYTILAFCSDILFWHSIWHPFWHLFWHFLWHSIWHSFGYSIRHLFWHSFWISSIYSVILVDILFWYCIWFFLAFYLTILFSGIISGICCDIFSGMGTAGFPDFDRELQIWVGTAGLLQEEGKKNEQGELKIERHSPGRRGRTKRTER